MIMKSRGGWMWFRLTNDQSREAENNYSFSPKCFNQSLLLLRNEALYSLDCKIIRLSFKTEWLIVSVTRIGLKLIKPSSSWLDLLVFLVWKTRGKVWKTLCVVCLRDRWWFTHFSTNRISVRIDFTAQMTRIMLITILMKMIIKKGRYNGSLSFFFLIPVSDSFILVPQFAPL